MVKLEYDAFLGRFVRDAALEHLRGLEQDHQGLMAQRVNQMRQLKLLQKRAADRQLPGLSNWAPGGVYAPLVVRLLNRETEAAAAEEEPELIMQGEPELIMQEEPELIMQGEPALIVQGEPALIVQ